MEPEASGEQAGDRCDIERYEQLRAGVMDGDGDCFRMGLAMLHRTGLAAWARATEGAIASAPTASQVEIKGGAHEIVDALATMALACVAG